jgi:hypothetical protein
MMKGTHRRDAGKGIAGRIGEEEEMDDWNRDVRRAGHAYV